MKKFVFLAMTLGIILGLSASSGIFQNDSIPSNLGIRLDNTSACNDYYLVCTMKDTKIYECHGYEYGCGQDLRTATGTLHLAGGYAYFGFTVNSIGHDGGVLGYRQATILLSTKSGSGPYEFIYRDSGVVNGHGGTSNWVVSQGPYPDAVSPGIERDEQIR